MSNDTILPKQIDANAAYQLPHFCQIVGLKRTAISRARKAAEKLGITLVRRAHGRSYVRGEDWLAYLAHAPGDIGHGGEEKSS